MEARLVQGAEAEAQLQELRAGAVPVTPLLLADEATREPVGIALRGELAIVPWFAGYMRRALDRGHTAAAVSLTIVAGPTTGGMIGLFSLVLHDDGRERRLHLLVDALEGPSGWMLLRAIRRFRAFDLWPDPPLDGLGDDDRLPFRVGADVLSVCEQASGFHARS